MKFKKRTIATTLAATTVLGMGGPTWADEGVGAALFGGMILGGAVQRNRQAQRNSAYQSGYSQGQSQAPQTVVVERAAPSGGESAEQRIRNLKSLYDQGLISDAEYKSRRQEILDSL
jgi:hypothetical protein